MKLQLSPKLNGNNAQYVIESVLGQSPFGVTCEVKGYAKAKGAFGEVEVDPHLIATKKFFMRDINQRDDDGSISGLSESRLAYKRQTDGGIWDKNRNALGFRIARSSN